MRTVAAWLGSAIAVSTLAFGASAAGGGTVRRSAEVPLAATQAGPGCTTHDLRGSYGFTRSGETATGPLAAVGMVTFDGQGRFGGTQMISRNGVFSQVTFTDNLYRVDPDCTGFWEIEGVGTIAYFALVAGGDEAFLLSTQAGNTITGTAKRITRRIDP